MQIRIVFKTLILQEILRIQNLHQVEHCGGILCIFGSQTFVPISWMCKKQTSVSHSSAEAEIIFLDAGLRMDGIPALTLWDLVIEIFQSVPNRTDGAKERATGKTVGSCQAKHAKTHPQSSTPTSLPQALITFHQIQRILVPVRCCMSLKTMRQ